MLTNVVFVLSDDQSWSDYGFMGHPHIKTPNLDRLAAEGLVYERGYTTAAICRPSLASIVTGLYPHQTAVRGNRPFMGEGVDHLRLRANKKLWPLAQEQSKAMTATLEHAPSMVKQLQDNVYPHFRPESGGREILATTDLTRVLATGSVEKPWSLSTTSWTRRRRTNNLSSSGMLFSCRTLRTMRRIGFI